MSRCREAVSLLDEKVGERLFASVQVHVKAIQEAQATLEEKKLDLQEKQSTKHEPLRGLGSQPFEEVCFFLELCFSLLQCFRGVFPLFSSLLKKRPFLFFPPVP